MATHSSIHTWRILWTEEPGGLQFMGSQRVGHDLAIKQWQWNKTYTIVKKFPVFSSETSAFLYWGNMWNLSKYLLPGPFADSEARWAKTSTLRICVETHPSSFLVVNSFQCLAYSSEKAMAPHSSTLAWRIPWTEESCRLQSMGSWRVRHDWATSLWLFTFMHWWRKWQPTLVFLPGESQGQRSLLGCSLWGHTESDTTDTT